MRKNEIKKATNSELIYELTQTFATFIHNYNTVGKGYKQALSHSKDLAKELHNRNLLQNAEYEKLVKYYLGDDIEY